MNFKKNLIIFAHLQTGLGHIRVTEALKEGLKDNYYATIGTSNTFLPNVHFFLSNTRLGRFLMSKFQYGFWEQIGAKIVKIAAATSDKSIYNQIKAVLELNKDKNDILFIATHFAPAQNIVNIKHKLKKDFNKNCKLAVYVTDDSPQQVWCINGADVIFVPSKKTKYVLDQKLTNYKTRPEVVVCAYPISPRLAQKKSNSLQLQRISALSSHNKDININICVPISGASTGLKQIIELLKNLAQVQDNFRFYVICLANEYNLGYKKILESLKNTNIAWCQNPFHAAEKYIETYTTNTICIEITKPSELSFKSILEPTCIGGSIEVFLEPVGRQEQDNIKFLEAHKLLPNQHQLKILFENPHILSNHIVDWQSISLSSNTQKACSEFEYFIKKDIFKKMVDISTTQKEHNIETSPYGVSFFWNYLREIYE